MQWYILQSFQDFTYQISKLILHLSVLIIFFTPKTLQEVHTKVIPLFVIHFSVQKRIKIFYINITTTVFIFLHLTVSYDLQSYFLIIKLDILNCFRIQMHYYLFYFLLMLDKELII